MDEFILHDQPLLASCAARAVMRATLLAASFVMGSICGKTKSKWMGGPSKFRDFGRRGSPGRPRIGPAAEALIAHQRLASKDALSDPAVLRSGALGKRCEGGLRRDP
jgi:hypothetical protein